MGGEKAGACVTDFPYNIGKDYGAWNDSLSEGEFWSKIVPAWLDGISSTFSSPAHFITSFSERGMWKLISACETAGFVHRHTGVWHNPNRLAGSYPGQWPFAWEPILDFSFGGWLKLRNGNSVGHSDVWVLDNPIGNKTDAAYHPAEKPMQLYADLVDLTTQVGEIIFEPFAGSGTTGIACHNLGRKARMIEISPSYSAVILQRFYDAFGITGELCPA